ncbi:3'-5' exonuclease [Ureibacillus manganicus]|uniref:Exonuclease domain-containing protein n=1 Tax=Ureibacillus manganicus DSM 26584 TaxID=1384049 RepID=A0A0A3IXD3_9BACL|nr:3'-5' exonuclease [Ureibacillus manganicus]KGR79482.1 hypothetical protein CD29_05130 [Ureibacillus manganicus DSM 26584]
MATLIFLDIEATLINGKQHIIEIGACKWSPNNTIESFEHLIRPSKFKRLNRHIQNLTGITTEELLKAPTFLTVMKEFMKFCDELEGEKIFVTFGEFDRKVLEEEFMRHQLNKDFLYPIVDFQQKYMIEHQLKNQPSLNLLMESLNIEIDQQHRALADAKSLLKIFRAIDGLKLIENQKTNEFIFLVSDMNQKEKVYNASITYISGIVENEYITINEAKNINRDLPFEVRTVEKITAEGETSIVQIYDIHPNQSIKNFLTKTVEKMNHKVLISTSGLKTISKIFRLHGISLPKTESMSLKQLVTNETGLNQLTQYTDTFGDDSNIIQQFEKLQNVIIEEFKRRNLLNDEITSKYYHNI